MTTYDTTLEDICRSVWKQFTIDLENGEKLRKAIKDLLEEIKLMELSQLGQYQEATNLVKRAFHDGYAEACKDHAEALQKILDNDK